MSVEPSEREKALPKRFYQAATVAEQVEGGFGVLLDQRPLRTPARRKLVLPTREAAALIAQEFAVQEKVIDPARMPVTRIVNSAIDGIGDGGEALRRDLLQYAGGDLLCYRADSPAELQARQQALWDPVLQWAEQELGARMRIAIGVVHVPQDVAALAAIEAALARNREPIVLAALHTMTTLTGSLLLAMAVLERALTAEAAWDAAHVDEDWNIAQWGEDYEAAERRALRRGDMMAAANLAAAMAGQAE